MKNFCASFVFVFCFQLSFGQIGFEENVVVGDSYTNRYPKTPRTVDIDGDGDLDLLVTGRGLSWHENIDGLAGFGEKNEIDDVILCRSVYAGDFDMDGDIDVLNVRQEDFTIYENTDGNGSFEEIQNVEVDNGQDDISVALADIDADGDLDILCYSRSNFPYASNLTWYENTDGTFNTEAVIFYDNELLNEAASFLISADIDGDNLEDLVVGQYDADTILWLKNIDGTGAFTEPNVITTLANGVTSLFTGDLDNDGDVDIISSSENDNEIAWYNNQNGLGDFSDEIVITSNAALAQSVHIADVNNDGFNDVIVASLVEDDAMPDIENKVVWFANNGSGTFGSEQNISNTAYGVSFVGTTDLDVDGNLDVIVASDDDNKVAWYPNVSGNGDFGRQTVIVRRIRQPRTVFHADFDGDNDLDLLVSSQSDAKLTWFENVNGLGLYGKQYIITEHPGSGSPTPFSYPGDFDGDGDMDIAVSEQGVFSWYENVDGNGNFTTEHIINDNEPGVSIIRSDDIDGDGDMDIIFGVYSADKIAWIENTDGNGTFGVAQIIADSGGDNGALTSLEIADMDGDNDKDIIASSFNTRTWFYRNTDGQGNFQYEFNSILDDNYAVYPADIDGDGDNDIVGVSSLGGGFFHAVVWYENADGNASFTVEHDVSTESISGRSINVADMDNDGDLDVVTISDGAQLAWYENDDGNGNFGERYIIDDLPTPNEGRYVNIADVDNDSDMDLIAIYGYGPNSSFAKVSVFENLGVLGNTVNGNVRIDTNADGCNNDDLAGSNVLVIAENGFNTFATFTDVNGDFQMATTDGNFSAAITSDIPDYFMVNPTEHTFNFSDLNGSYAADFCIEPIGAINDLSVVIYPTANEPRPGFDTYYRLVYKNIGTTQLSGSVTFEFDDSKIQFLNASDTVTSQTANTLTFDYTDLNPFETQTIYLQFNVFPPPTTNIDDVLVSIATINPVSGDETEEDNIFALEQTVIGSYDPNDIRVLEGDEVLIDDIDKYLHYIIRFQNTGTASAINVRVEHILDDKLDWTTMQLESLSHTGRVEITDGSDVQFIFDNINLPDSTTDEAGSIGYITFKIKPKQDVLVGDIISGVADIYFDFNPPIITNTVNTEIVEPLSVDEFELNNLKLFPNPAQDQLQVSSNQIMDNISVVDINGRQLNSIKIGTSVYNLDVKRLSKGIYFLEIQSGSVTITKKFIKN